MMSGNPYRGQGDDWDLWHLTPKNEQSGQQRDPNVASTSRKVEFTMGDSFPVTSPQRNVFAIDEEKKWSDHKNKTANAITGLVNILAENIISHPFIVLRRQCQVNRKSMAYHLTPFTLIPFVFRLQRKQGLGIMWKGVGSVLITRGMMIACESIIAEVTPLPRDLSSKRWTFDSIFQHLLFKGMTVVIVTPFLCSSCIETVQSAIASENPGVLDCIAEGIYRAAHWRMGMTSRLFSIWTLCGATLLHELSYYLIYSFVTNFSLYIIKSKRNESNEPNENWQNQLNEIVSSFWGNLAASVLLFPLQTVLYRVYLQGTRTIIDNVDETSAVIPVISEYDSIYDCYQTIVQEEGASGLFKGFGALVLQFAIHYSIIKITKFFVVKVIPALDTREPNQ